MTAILRTAAAGRKAAALAALLLAGAAAGCASHASRILVFRENFGAGNYEAAEDAVHQLLREDSGAALETIAGTHGLDDSVDPASGNTYLLLLEEAMVRLARGDGATCVKVLRKARDELDKHYSTSFESFLKAALTDDEAMAYAGADYEHVLIRVLLAVTDLLQSEGDAYAYSLQVGEKQEEIIGSDFGDPKSGYYPRRQYQRVAIGAYVQGVIQESNLYASEAALAYERGLQWMGQAPAPAAAAGAAAPAAPAEVQAASQAARSGAEVMRAALERARSGQYAPPGNGVLHVFYLGGRGPHLEQTTSTATSQAIQMAAIGYSIASGSVAQLGQAPVPVPMVVVTDWVVPPLPVSVDGGPPAASTNALLDVNLVAKQQLDANMQGIVARAVIRRAAKGAVGGVIESQGGDFGKLMGLLFTAASTSAERAETRNWTSLPAQFQVARVAVPEGDRRVSFGPGMEATVRITRGRDSYAVVLRPNLGLPGTVLIDAGSRVAAKASPAAAPIPAPAAAPAAAPPVPAPGKK